MNKNLAEKTQEWKQLERKTFEQRQIADEFYERNLMKLIEEDFIGRNKAKVFEKVEYLVASVGTSYEPIVLNIRLLRPKRILFLHTAETESTLSKIVKYCELEVVEYEKRRVSETSPLDIYQEIKRSYIDWGKPGKMYIDFTGGTKAMSAAAAMAGAMIDVQLVYVGSNDYLTDFRKPNPGSETLFYIDNPLAVFGDFEIEKALALFEKYNYAGAQEKLGELKENIPDPAIRQQMNFVYLLAKVYEAWDALDFGEAFAYIRKLNHQLRRDRMMHDTFLLMDCYECLEKQEEILRYLNEIPEMLKKRQNAEIIKSKSIMHALMFTMYQSACIREKQEKYDMATLLFYRLLEMVEQRRMSHYGLYVSQMNYAEIKYDKKYQPAYGELDAKGQFELFKGKVKEIKAELFGRPGNEYLPDQVSLLEGVIMLMALGDPIVHSQGKREVDKLKRIRAMVYLRNNSIFAHGLGPVSYGDYTKFKNFVLEIFQGFCAVERVNYQAYANHIKWINPLKSKNYVMGMGGN
ncbi:MAG: TIGR02710 family CRISPR-associated protein [Lachnospiraceae bacterium]|jgi:CRISPR-associated protein (TIGR02710 family)|nr:TIGR02710 family CRISPR-associated protein [Lachnospiraceae bacterium]